LKTIAQDCGESEVAALLGKTLEEEKLTRLAETEINKTAIAASPSA
jgi:ferritin-like metal-binding protein YciE